MLNVSTQSILNLTFSENINLSSGAIKLYKGNDRSNELIKTFEASPSSGIPTEIKVFENGDYEWRSKKEFTKKKGRRVFVTASSPPSFTFDNYKEVLFKEGLGQAFLNTIVVALPSTLIPLTICSFFAYALAWM